jgi:hypothetical protein
MGYISVSIAMTVNINLTWDLNQNYNVQEGSIVQIVAYRTGNGSNPTGDADDNFTVLNGSQCESDQSKSFKLEASVALAT